MSLIETPNSRFKKLLGKRLWLLDSGASYHMTGNISFLYNVSNLPPIPVKLPNGIEVMATKHRMVGLSPNVILRYVLFIPRMTCNLVSIRQLIRELFCTVTFTYKLCMIQDHSMRNLIGVGEPRRWVYYLKHSLPARVQVNKVASYDT